MRNFKQPNIDLMTSVETDVIYQLLQNIREGNDAYENRTDFDYYLDAFLSEALV